MYVCGLVHLLDFGHSPKVVDFGPGCTAVQQVFKSVFRELKLI